MTGSQSSPEERINQDAKQGQSEIRRGSVLVNFELLPGNDTSHWPSQFRLDDPAACAMFWGFMDKMFQVGLASSVEGKPVVVLNASEEDAEWLPKVSEMATWGSKMTMLFLRLCWFGKDERRTQLNPVGRSDDCLFQVEGKPVCYEVKVLPEIFGPGLHYAWAVLTLEESDGRLVQLYTPAFYDDEAAVRERCEAAMEGKKVWATGYWYASGAGRVFRVKEWSRVIDPPEGSALEEIAEIL